MKDALTELAEEIHARMGAMPADPAIAYIVIARIVMDEWKVSRPDRWADAIDQLERMENSAREMREGVTVNPGAS